MALYPIQPSFAGGELASSLWGRVDLAKYQVGLRRCENWIIHPHGGVSKRRGMRFVAKTKYQDKRSILVSFQYNLEQSYMLEFGDKYVRFFAGGAPVLAGGVPYEVVTPYSEADLPGLSFTQSADVLYILHAKHAPRELWRRNVTEWVLELFKFAKGPFIMKDPGQDEISISFSGMSGEVTATASADLFKAGHVGSVWVVNQYVDEMTAETSGEGDSGLIATTMIPGLGAFRYIINGEHSQLINTGTRIVYGARRYSVSAIFLKRENQVIFRISNGPKIEQNTVANIEIVVPADLETWGPELLVYKNWSVRSTGFWYGDVGLQRFDEDENRWITMRTYSSVHSKSSAKNYTDSGEVEKPTRMRLIILTSFRTFVPSGNVEQDRGKFQLSRSGTFHRSFFTISEVLSATSAKVEIVDTLATNEGTLNWQEGAWSDYRGFPQAAGFYQERLVMGNTPSQPQSFWLSKSGDYYDFGVSAPVKDDDAAKGTLASRQVNAIRHFVALNDMVIMTSGAEWRLSAGSSGGAITPSSMDVRPQGYRGSAELEPIVVGQMIIFVQGQGSRVRDLGYTFESDSYTGNDLTVLANHLFDGKKIASWAYQQEPDSLCWVVRDDGLLCSLTYLREHDVIAWGRHPTNGLVESVATVKSPNDDSVYLIVNRGGVRCVEIMNERAPEAPADSFYLDGAVTVRSDLPVVEISGLDHLEGQTVSILADGSVRNDVVVSGGKVNIGLPAKVVHVGLGYKALLETLDLIFQRNDGTQLTRKSRVSSVAIRVEKTRGIFAGVDEAHLQENVERGVEPYGSPTSLITGDARITMDSGFDSGRIVISAPHPLPASILAIVPEVIPGG